MTRSRLSISFILSTLVALASCGVKSPPIPPEMAQPERIFDLQAVSRKDAIHVSWHRPDHYVNGGMMRDLGNFKLSRAEGDGRFLPITRIAVTDNDRFQKQQVFTYVDDDTFIGRTYHYQVVAETTDGYTSEPSNVANVIRRLPPPPPTPENFVLPGTTPSP